MNDGTGTSDKKPRKTHVVHKVDELEAMRKCDKIISDLPHEQKARVANWLYDRYNPTLMTLNGRIEDLTAEDVAAQ